MWSGRDDLSPQGRSRPFFAPEVVERIVETVRETEDACNKETTVAFLHRIDDWVRSCGREVVVIWDGAPWHRAKIVQQTAKELGITVVALPGYSPDLNPIEGLWKWMREEVTQHHCHDTVRDLFDACKRFIDEINRDPLAIVQRLWPRFDLDPEVEKLGFSS